MKSVEKQVILITGATDGLGRALANELARHGATLIIHGRDEEKGRRTIEEIREHTPAAPVAFIGADLSRFDEVRELADVVLSRQPRLDVLVNNAGIYTDERRISEDGNELVFQVNYLSHVLLTRLLLPLLERSAPARIVNVASAGQETIDFDDLLLERSFSGGTAYRRSKLAQILFTVDLSEELRGTQVTVNALHPATYMPTKMVVGRIPPTNTLDEGMKATFRLVAGPDVEGVTGRYYHMTEESRANSQAYDANARGKLREVTNRIIGNFL